MDDVQEEMKMAIKDWKIRIDDRFEKVWNNGRQSIYVNKSSKHKGWIVGIDSPSDGYALTHPKVYSENQAINIAKMLMKKSPKDFREYYFAQKRRK